VYEGERQLNEGKDLTEVVRNPLTRGTVTVRALRSRSSLLGPRDG
jgi:hypothetical protein